MAQERLQKIIARAGVASRRKAEQLIETGAVTVNGQIVDTLPAFADLENDTITVNRKRVRPEKKVYFILNKPKGVICTNSDPAGRRKAIDLVPAQQRIFCVGRLDADTTGLVILTNDSFLTNKLTHPSHQVPKTYLARVKGKPNPDQIQKLKKGIWLAEGKTGKAAVKIAKKTRTESWIEITISQGLNRQVRRMFAKVELDVKALKRARIGKISDRGIGVGKFRHLTPDEVRYLNKLAK